MGEGLEGALHLRRLEADAVDLELGVAAAEVLHPAAVRPPPPPHPVPWGRGRAAGPNCHRQGTEVLPCGMRGTVVREWGKP